MVPDEANDAVQLLKDRLATISDVRGIGSLLLWDQQTYMPAGGVAGRAEQLPVRLVEELARATALAEPAWRRARAVSD